MSTAFTTVSPTTPWQTLDYHIELRKAIWERNMALMTGSWWDWEDDDDHDNDYEYAAEFPTVGHRLQRKDYYWGFMQLNVEDLVTSFYDYTLDFTGSGNYNGPPSLTLSTWRTLAGLPSGGFRRATTWPTDWTDNSDAAYSFGQPVIGDIIGPWLIVDLQRGLSALRMTSSETGYTNAYYSTQTWADEAAWRASPTFPAASSGSYHDGTPLRYSVRNDTTGVITGVFQYGRMTVSQWTGRPCKAAFYLFQSGMASHDLTDDMGDYGAEWAGYSNTLIRLYEEAGYSSTSPHNYDTPSGLTFEPPDDSFPLSGYPEFGWFGNRVDARNYATMLWDFTNL